ncbi:MAG: class I SAM-dependent methyltransferase [Opitutaceae bacterium]
MNIDYSRICECYDANPDRHLIAVDAEISCLLQRSGRGRAVHVLDLGCGTGNWLAVQTRALASSAIEWHGLDASPDMLRVARAKVPAARLVEGRAENLPYRDGEFDFVAVNFAFHHFGDKDAALDEIVRVLAAGGSVRMNNLAAESADRWWVYRYFPAAIAIDRSRFWPVDRIVTGLAARGVPSEVAFTLDDRPARLAARIEEARRRDISQLHLITEEEYREGLAAMARELQANPDAEIAKGIPLYSLLGRKR